MKSYCGGPVGTHQHSFERYHPRPSTASPSLRLGVCNPNPKLQSLLSQERVKLRTANLADSFTGSIRTKAHEKFGRKGSVGVSGDCPNFLSTLLSQEGWSYELQIWQVHSHGPSRQKPIKNFGEKAAWAYPGTVQIFWIPPIISGKVKAMKVTFCTHIHRVDRNKSPVKCMLDWAASTAVSVWWLAGTGNSFFHFPFGRSSFVRRNGRKLVQLPVINNGNCCNNGRVVSAINS